MTEPSTFNSYVYPPSAADDTGPQTEPEASPQVLAYDEEVLAMSMCSMAITALDPRAQARVIRWLSDRYLLPPDQQI